MNARSFLVGTMIALSGFLVIAPAAAEVGTSRYIAQAQPTNTTRPAAQQGGSTMTDSALARLAVPIGGKQEVRGLPDYINTVYGYMLGIVTIVAIIMVIYGAFLFLLSNGDAKKASDGQRVIKDALGGMVVLFLAYFILYNVNPRTTRLDLVVTPVRSIAISGGQQVGIGRSCLKDADCMNAGSCLRTSSVGGICADGRPGNICKCRGAGCQVTAEQAGGATNNAGTGVIQCQTGSNCQEIQRDEWVCNGGEAMACNMSTRYVFDSRPINQRAANAGAMAAGAVAGAAVGAVLHVPFSSLVPYESVRGSDLSTTVRERQAVACTNGRTCFQRAEESAGACVYGDYRDMAMINNIPEERRNTLGILRNIERCDLTTENLRTLPYAQGGCRNLTNNSVDEFCIQHRYRCAAGSTCVQSEFADAFADTLRYYGSWDRAPAQLRPESFFKQGCRKPASASCTNDNECAGRCIQGRCSGTAYLAIASDVQRGSIRESGITAAQLQFGAFPPGACDNTWSAVSFLEEAGSDPRKQAQAVELLFRAGTSDRFACYPRRAAGQKCDIGLQCASGVCEMPEQRGGIAIPPTLNAPLDTNVGIGTCR